MLGACYTSRGMTQKHAATVGDVLGLYWRYAKRRRWQMLAAISFTAISVGADALVPLALKRLVDAMSVGEVGASALQAALAALWFLALLRLIAWVFWRMSGWINAHFQPHTMADIQKDAYEYLMGHSYQFFSDSFAGSLVRKINRLMRGFAQFADEITYQWIPIVIVLTGAIIGLYDQAPLFAWIFISWFVILFIFSIWAAKWAVKADVERSEIDSQLGGRMADTVSNAVTIKIFGTFEREVSAFRKLADTFAQYQIRSWRRHEFIFLVQSSLGIGVELLLMYLGLRMWGRGEISVGDLIFIQSYLAIVFKQVWEMARSMRHLFDAYAEGKEMVELLQKEHGVKDRKGAKQLQVQKGAIAFDRVTFGFGKNTVFTDFSVKIRSKEKVALVGPSGAGKTTVTALLFRFFNIRKGRILIDGQNIAHVTQESLRKAISMVPQDPILFHRSLRENITYGKPNATDAEMIEAAKKAHCHEFIQKIPGGYDAFVGERGIKLSGGERQRVAIARAILEDAPILVLDEATSALDSESETLIQDALKELMKNKTVIAIAHRLSTIVNMDRILVIQDGHIAAQGTHAELAEKEGVYKNLWSLQAGEFLDG